MNLREHVSHLVAYRNSDWSLEDIPRRFWDRYPLAFPPDTPHWFLARIIALVIDPDEYVLMLLVFFGETPTGIPYL